MPLDIANWPLCDVSEERNQRARATRARARSRTAHCAVVVVGGPSAVSHCPAAQPLATQSRHDAERSRQHASYFHTAAQTNYQVIQPALQLPINWDVSDEDFFFANGGLPDLAVGAVDGAGGPPATGERPPQAGRARAHIWRDSEPKWTSGLVLGVVLGEDGAVKRAPSANGHRWPGTLRGEQRAGALALHQHQQSFYLGSLSAIRRDSRSSATRGFHCNCLLSVQEARHRRGHRWPLPAPCSQLPGAPLTAHGGGSASDCGILPELPRVWEFELELFAEITSSQ
jgi:hypothetical protein